MPLAAISCMRFIFVRTSPTRRPFDNAKPVPPAAASAGISTRKPHGIAVLTAVMVAGELKSSLRAVEKQKVAIVRMASQPAKGWIYFDHATQIPDTATFWKRCGD